MVAIATILTGFEAVSSLLGIGDPGVTLGPFVFDGMEIPEKISWGGQHQTTEHKLIGGARQIDMMGPDEDDIDWSGTFFGSDAASRARQLDVMRVSGKQFAFTWADFSRPKVVIAKFKADYGTAGQVIPYQITIKIIPQPGIQAQPSLLSTIGSDIVSALGVPNLAADVSGAISLAQRALPLVGVITGGSKAYLGLVSAMGTASSAASTAASFADRSLDTLSSGAASLGQVTGGTDALTATAAFSATSLAAQASAAAHEAGAYVGRIASNLSRASS